MDIGRSLETARAYLAAQMVEAKTRAQREAEPAALFVTISRQSGAGGLVVAERLAQILNQRGFACPRTPWVVFDKNLLQRVIEENRLPESYMDQMEEKVLPRFQTVVNEMLSVHPAVSRLVAHTSRTILHLATMGSSVLVGRGANLLAAGLPGGLHVRLVGSPGRRLQFLIDHYGLTREEASRRMTDEDEGRSFYVKKHFNRDVDDPLLYHLVLSTDLLGHDGAASLIAAALETKSGSPAG